MKILDQVLAASFNVSPAQPPNTNQIQTILNWGGWIVLGLCVLGLLIGAGRPERVKHFETRSSTSF